MFSDSRAPAPGEQKAFKPPHAPHFIPWLRNSLKPQHGGGDLNGPYKPGTNNRTSLEKTKGIGFFSKKGDVRCSNGVARMLPVVLRGHNILKQREDSPARWTQSPELDPLPSKEDTAPGTILVQDNTTFVRNHLSEGTPVRKYGPLVRPTPAPVIEEPNCNKGPVVVDLELRKRYASTLRRKRDLHSSSWASPDTQIERQHGFTSSFSYIQQQSKSQRDLRDPVEGFNGPLNGVIFSTEVPQRGTATLRAPSKPRPSGESMKGQNQTWVQYKQSHEATAQRKGSGGTSSRKVVRNQIKRVVENLEQVLTALRDVHQEMREVVQQIDSLTSSIDLNSEGAEGDDSSSNSGSISSEVTAISTNQRPPDPGDPPSCRRDPHIRSKSPPNIRSKSPPNIRSKSPPSMQLCPVNSAFSDRGRTLRFTCSLGFSPRQGGPLHNNNPSQNVPSHDVHLSPQRHLPVRPPTPGLSPLTVNLHHHNSPGSHSPNPSPLSPNPPAALSPSVIEKDKLGTPQSDHPSAGLHSKSAPQPPSAPATQAKPPKGRRGRKPPPYPHLRPSEPTQKKVPEPRAAPPYPEKRLSTTV
ncbi:hypothetical protein PBY51_024958 [Eleginops maclovinus]|uniref:Uncharacterized protein n=1 Tax=Eleginops maclovinus TaxID=56733 RepID=A0AAN8AWG8_ELEMC|nr:hypothetical protein PBY51_024958 [Eleginops maclovinus]